MTEVNGKGTPALPAAWADLMAMKSPIATVACNLDASLLQAIHPLLETGEIHAIEWSFDSLFKLNSIPSWFKDLLMVFGEKGRLVGHGVFFSIFSGKWKKEHSNWLKQLHNLSQQFSFDHVSEHFGFLTGESFHRGAPLGVPLTNTTLSIGRDRLQRISEAAQCPVGLENLAFAWSHQAVKEQGDFLDQLLEPVNGFLILDLHNLYCQAHNFGLAPEELIASYPLDRVREIHISGGSWEPHETAPDGKVRRDTHDNRVPDEVFRLLRHTIPICSNLKFVVLEHMGIALSTEEQRSAYASDFRTMSAILETSRVPQNLTNDFISPPLQPLGVPLESPPLARQQKLLSEVLESVTTLDSVRTALLNSELAQTAWQVEKWPDHMLETACQIAKKWG